jgi:hypothetical protein
MVTPLRLSSSGVTVATCSSQVSTFSTQRSLPRVLTLGKEVYGQQRCCFRYCVSHTVQRIVLVVGRTIFRTLLYHRARCDILIHI